MHLERLDTLAELCARGHDDALDRALVDLSRRRLDDEHAQRLARCRECRHERGRAQAVVQGALDGNLYAHERASRG